MTVKESPIEKNTTFCPFSSPITHVLPCETTTEKNTSFCPFPPPQQPTLCPARLRRKGTHLFAHSPLHKYRKLTFLLANLRPKRTFPLISGPPPYIPTPPTREALSVDTTLGDPIRQTVPELETTPTGILPITKTEQTSKANRKVTFLDPQKMSYQDIFDETYSLELENLLSSGLSHKLAVSTALALAQTAVQELFTPTPAIPARSKSKSVSSSNFTPVLSSTQRAGPLPTGGFQDLGSIIPSLPPHVRLLPSPDLLPERIDV